MTTEQTRSLVAQLVIAAAICGGIHAMVAEPLRAKAHRAEAEVSAFIGEHRESAALLADMPDVVATQEATLHRAAEFDARGQPARDEAAMFSQVLELASDAGLTVEQIIPSGEGQTAALSGTDQARREGDQRVRYTLSGSGPFAAAATFLEQLQSDWGYCAIRSYRLTPDYAGAGGVRFTMLIELFSFDASPVALVPDDAEGSP